MNTSALGNQQVKIKRNGRLFKIIKQFLLKENLIAKDNETLQLMDEIDAARKEWVNACKNYEFADDVVIIDYYIYNMKACQIKYEHLLRLAKQKGIKANLLENEVQMANSSRLYN